MSKAKLSRHELEHIKEREEVLIETIYTLNNIPEFEEGDYLIAFNLDDKTNEFKKIPILNSYGVPKKFIVVYVDANGVPYIKELNKEGKATGNIISPIKINNYISSDGITVVTMDNIIFEIDPDFTDAIILDNQENYNATDKLKIKSENFQEIAKHNKRLKINCINTKVLASFFGTVKVGDILWRSNTSYYVVSKINPIRKDSIGRLIEWDPFLEVTTNKGANLTLSLDDFWRTALYSAQPRSYRELKDPK